MTQEALKRLLRRTWGPFFSRFGRLLPVQRAAIPRVLAGDNLVVASPTASGKTEAVVAPLAEMLLAAPQDGLGVLYVSPTRALVNDLEVRIKEPLVELGLSVAVRTGDRPQFQPRRATDFLLTTPEALDALLCRHPAVFRTLRAVVVDELHLIDGTYRGDQLRLLLQRLRLLTGPQLRVHALSATLADPVAMAARYVPDPTPVIIEGQRELTYMLVASFAEALKVARTRRLHKLLVFANSRRRVEALAIEARAHVPARLVVVHHGSLARREREEVEAFLRTAPAAVCVATMTLEIGIDIGNIDAVVLAEPPPSVVALLQRVGRGNRRRQHTCALAVCTSQAERAVVEAMLWAAQRGELDACPYQPDRSVVVQQLFSLLFAHPRGLAEPELLSVCAVLCPPEEVHTILGHLVDRGLLVYRQGRYGASSRVMDLGERGRIHSNVPERTARKVIDVQSRRLIGEIHEPVATTFALAGRAWQVVAVRANTIMVRQVTGDALPPAFRTDRPQGAFASYLPPHLRSD
ncbi:MAG: hypothetical protein KatS3mg131_0183 [Candidatus Tectimicrobiota bacterium]|nr:MAG: hypothetical protein KatS3mg131_0183 [Candidatus Tectomicrobia bacterium]